MSQKKLWEPTVHCGIKQTKEEVVIIKHFTTAEPETQELVGTKNGAKREWEFKFSSKQMMTLLYKIPCYTCWPPWISRETPHFHFLLVFLSCFPISCISHVIRNVCTSSPYFCYCTACSLLYRRVLSSSTSERRTEIRENILVLDVLFLMKSFIGKEKTFC